jgi:unsaturated rhamnogalacturonyl hydrolase
LGRRRLLDKRDDMFGAGSNQNSPQLVHVASHNPQARQYTLNAFNAMIDCGHRVARKVMVTHDAAVSYARDLGLEAMLEFSVASNTPSYASYVQDICQIRGATPTTSIPYTLQPFSCLTFEMYLLTKDSQWLPNFIDQTARWRQEEIRSGENAVMHPRGNQREAGHAILIDSLQCYASRMAAAGAVTGDETFFQECAEQYRIHRHLLRAPSTGLWSRGRGWLKVGDKRPSPGAWSRGHG